VLDALDDHELARRFPSGDPDVVAAVYERYGRAVHTVAMSFVHDRQLADDVVQATFLNAWKASSTFDPSRRLAPWLYSIARRQAIDVSRKARRVEPVTHDRLERSRDGVEAPDAFNQAWEAWQLRLALDQLPPDEEEIVRLLWFDGLSHSEAADRLELPVGTVKSRGFRAQRRLASLLAHLEDGANRTPRPDVENGDTTRGGARS